MGAAGDTTGSVQGVIPSVVLEVTVTGVGRSTDSVGKIIGRATDNGGIENRGEALGAVQDKFGGEVLSASMFMT